MNGFGVEIFDIIDNIDRLNLVPPLVRILLDMIRKYFGKSYVFRKRAFSEKCLAWIQTLRLARDWGGAAWDAEAMMMKAFGNLEEAMNAQTFVNKPLHRMSGRDGRGESCVDARKNRQTTQSQ